MTIGDTNVYDVGLALIAAIPAIAAAIFAGIVALRTKTTNGTSIGQMVEQAHTLATENNEILHDPAVVVATVQKPGNLA